MLELGQEWLLYITPFRMKETDAPSGGEILPNAISLYAKDRSSISSLYWMNDAGTEFDLAAMATGTGVANRVAFWSGTSTLSSDADLTFVTDTLTATKLVVPTLATFTAAATFSFLTAGRIPYAGTAGALSDSANLFWDNSNTRLGIGTSSPGFLTHLVTQATGFKIVLDNYNDTFGAIVNLRSAKNTLASPSAVTTDFGLGRIAFSGWTSGSAFSNQTAIIQALAAEGYTGSNQGSYITFMTTALSSTSVTERFRIGPSGQWGIGGATYGTSGQYFKSGGASAAPSWATISDADLGSIFALLAGRSGGQVLIGGTAAADDLTLRATAGSGAGSENIIFQVGNNGATEAARFEHSGQLRFGSAQSAVRSLWIDNALDSTAFISVGIQPTYTGGTVTQLQGLNVQPTYSPTGNVTVAAGCVLIAAADPGAGATVAELQGALFRATAAGTDGAITSQFGASFESTYSSTLKPTNSFGIVVRDVGNTGITLSSGIYIAKPTGSTSNYYLAVDTGDGTALGSYAGRLPVQVGGVTQYIPYYN